MTPASRQTRESRACVSCKAQFAARKPAIFARIGVAQHNLLEVVAGGKLQAVDRRVEQLLHQTVAAVQVVNGFKERHQVKLGHPALAFKAQQAALFGKQKRLQHIGHGMGHADNVCLHALRGQATPRPPYDLKDLKDAARFRGQVGIGGDKRARVG